MSYVLPIPDAVTGPTTGDEREMVCAYLQWQRTTLLNICAGLTGEQLAERPLAAPTLSLLGLIRHLAKVERVWLRERVAGEDIPRLYGGAGDQTDFEEATAEQAEGAVLGLQQEWVACDAAVKEASWEHEVTVRGETMSVRMIYLHLIGEYARHNGHADQLREALDGVTGR
jgi:uncharacterized damage-inducible protein DinB